MNIGTNCFGSTDIFRSDGSPFRPSHDELVRLVAERAELLAACQTAAEFLDIFEEQSEAAFGDWYGRRERIRAAIAKVTAA